MARSVGMLAGFVPGYQFQHPQRQTGCTFLHQCQRIQSEFSAWRFGSQKKQLVKPLFGHRFQQRKHRGYRFADAGCSLGHQALTLAGGLVNSFGQVTLAGSEAYVRKGD